MISRKMKVETLHREKRDEGEKEKCKFLLFFALKSPIKKGKSPIKKRKNSDKLI